MFSLYVLYSQYVCVNSLKRFSHTYLTSHITIIIITTKKAVAESQHIMMENDRNKKKLWRKQSSKQGKLTLGLVVLVADAVPWESWVETETELSSVLSREVVWFQRVFQLVFCSSLIFTLVAWLWLLLLCSSQDSLSSSWYLQLDGCKVGRVK